MTTSEAREQIPVLKRRYRMAPPRYALFVDQMRGLFLHQDGTEVDYEGPVSLEEVLSLAGESTWSKVPQIIYLTGGYNAASMPRTEWFEAPKGWTRTAYHRHPLIAIYKHEKQSKTIYATSQWFGRCEDLQLIRQAYLRLQTLLQAAFGKDVWLLGTPARTGLDLIERSLPESKERQAYEWPVLPPEIRGMIEHNIGQGRMEMLRQSPGLEAEKLYIEDAIWMYSACCRRLPSGPVEHDTLNEFAGYQVGFYRVLFSVPQGWQHVGLLPTWNSKERRPIWPSRPSSYRYVGFVCAEELRVAIEQGWPVEIKERWLFAKGDGPAQDPLRNWVTKLRELRDQCTDERDGDLAPLLRGAIRAVCIKAIGSLHRKGRYHMVDTPLNCIEQIPEDAEIIWRSGEGVRWRKPIPLDAAMAHFAHPEWSAYIWGRARARLVKAALQLPRETIIALRSDAIVTIADPGWNGTKPGEFRLKRTIDLAGRPLPKTTREYLDFLQEEEEEE